MFTLLIVAHYIPLLIRRRMSGPIGLDKPLGLRQSGLLGVSFCLFPRAMEGEQGGYPNSSQSHRSRDRGCITNDRGRSKSAGKRVQLTWRPKTQSTEVAEPHAMQDVSDAEGSNPHSVPVSDAETSNLHSIPGDSVAGSDSDMEERDARKRAHAQPKLFFHGDDRSRGESSIYNAEPEVGNIGIFFGNWGQRASVDLSLIHI